jgi:two-component system LytT family sensor kinase
MSKPPHPTSVRFSTILIFAGVFALIIQSIIVTYNTITGFIRVETMAEYTFRVIYGSIISTLLALMIIYPDLFVINRLNRKSGWSKAPLRRVALQAGLTLVIAVTVSSLGTLGVNLIHKYTEDLTLVLITNAMITAVINIIAMTVLEAWLFFRDAKLAKMNTEKLQNELAIIRFEVLKNQINPHFLFNSLNVLSGLIGQDTQKAQKFIDAFARIYHYVLDTIEKPVVTLEDELGFARSYMYLQQIRHGDHVKFTVSMPATYLPMMLPPLSLQVVLENALKHNITGASYPLEVRLLAEPGWLEVSNDLRPKTSSGKSTGIGQLNLAKRYAMVCDRIPEFRIENNQYVVKLPLIPCED